MRKRLSTDSWELQDRLGCFSARAKGTCSNRLTIARHEIEERVLRAIRDQLMRRDFFEEFCREYTHEMNKLRMEYRASLTSGRTRDRAHRGAAPEADFDGG
jgi:site-specific DNA recombinase